MRTGRRLLAGETEEGVGDLWACLEGAVYPQRTPAPHLLRRSRGHRVCHALCRPESGAVVGDVVGTFLVEVLVTS